MAGLVEKIKSAVKSDKPHSSNETTDAYTNTGTTNPTEHGYSGTDSGAHNAPSDYKTKHNEPRAAAATEASPYWGSLDSSQQRDAKTNRYSGASSAGGGSDCYTYGDNDRTGGYVPDKTAAGHATQTGHSTHAGTAAGVGAGVAAGTAAAAGTYSTRKGNAGRAGDDAYAAGGNTYADNTARTAGTATHGTNTTTYNDKNPYRPTDNYADTSAGPNPGTYSTGTGAMPGAYDTEAYNTTDSGMTGTGNTKHGSGIVGAGKMGAGKVAAGGVAAGAAAAGALGAASGHKSHRDNSGMQAQPIDNAGATAGTTGPASGGAYATEGGMTSGGNATHQNVPADGAIAGGGVQGSQAVYAPAEARGQHGTVPGGMTAAGGNNIDRSMAPNQGYAPTTTGMGADPSYGTESNLAGGGRQGMATNQAVTSDQGYVPSGTAPSAGGGNTSRGYVVPIVAGVGGAGVAAGAGMMAAGKHGHHTVAPSSGTGTGAGGAQNTRYVDLGQGRQGTASDGTATGAAATAPSGSGRGAIADTTSRQARTGTEPRIEPGTETGTGQVWNVDGQPIDANLVQGQHQKQRHHNRSSQGAISSNQGAVSSSQAAYNTNTNYQGASGDGNGEGLIQKVQNKLHKGGKDEKSDKGGTSFATPNFADPTDASQVPPSVFRKHKGEPIVAHGDLTHDRARRNSSLSHQETFRGI